MQEEKKAIADSDAIKQLFVDNSDNIGVAVKKAMAINPTVAIGYQKQLLESQDADINVKKGLLDLHGTQASRLAQIAGGIHDQPSYESAIGDALHEQDIDANMAAQFLSKPYDPAFVKQLQQQALTAKEQIDVKAKEVDQAEQARHNKAEERQSQLNSDPVLKLSTPTALAEPGAQASIEALIADPNMRPEDLPRLRALVPKAAVAQAQAAAQKQRELRATQAVNQGDPVQAGKLLADRTLTLDELKTRGSTPQFIANAVQEAQKVDPNFKAPNAAAQAAIAKSATNQQFFGNTDSLLIKGGTLDQLEAAGAALGNEKIPALNSIENWTKAATGSGPLAAYAATALGVADDYSKVMTGGQGSDTSRTQALNIIKNNLSPEARQAAITQIRKSVQSQRQGRVGTNPYMKDMYPDPTSITPQSTQGVNVTDPNGGVHTFKDQASADAFKKAAGIK